MTAHRGPSPARKYQRGGIIGRDPAPQPVYDDLTDEQLMTRCRLGEQAAWSTLVRRFQRLIYTVPRRAGLDAEQAADVFQVCFARLYEHLDRIADPSRVRAWLVTTAKRECLRLIEETRRQAAPADGPADDADLDDPLARLPDPGPLQDEQLSALQQAHQLRLAVDRLDAPSRQLVELLFFQDEPLPYADIARRLGIPEGSIGPTRARCLAKLRKMLQEV